MAKNGGDRASGGGDRGAGSAGSGAGVLVRPRRRADQYGSRPRGGLEAHVRHVLARSHGRRLHAVRHRPRLSRVRRWLAARGRHPGLSRVPRHHAARRDSRRRSRGRVRPCAGHAQGRGVQAPRPSKTGSRSSQARCDTCEQPRTPACGASSSPRAPIPRSSCASPGSRSTSKGGSTASRWPRGTSRASPSPTPSSRARSSPGVQPTQAAVFEDALAGVAAGRAGGFGYVVGVDRREPGACVEEARRRRRRHRPRGAVGRQPVIPDARFPVEPWQVREVGARPGHAGPVGVDLRAVERAHRATGQPRRGRPVRAARHLPELVLRDAPVAVRRSRVWLSRSRVRPSSTSPTPSSSGLLVDDEPFDMRYGRDHQHERILDLRPELLHRDVTWASPSGRPSAFTPAGWCPSPSGPSSPSATRWRPSTPNPCRPAVRAGGQRGAAHPSPRTHGLRPL